MSAELYRQAQQLLRQSRQAVALTGAGTSVPSGIPDFRSPESGLWSRVDPAEVASLRSFQRDPLKFYEWFSETAGTMLQAEPNPAHYALSELEDKGILRTVVTQNIDGLHQKAGSSRVLELHGNADTGSCLQCGRQVAGPALLEHYRRHKEALHCDCGGLFKLDVIFFGEQLPLDVLREAQKEIAQCDLLLVVASSLVVAPASQLPWLAIQSGVPLIVCNLGRTWADAYAQVVIQEDIAVSLPALAAGCSGQFPAS
ncbi:MAG: NAD-dependent deacylase [Chloroflexia bacterium]|nr:NAD-dependent deacylase [Chloroflexia bacterium]